jgi:predicted Zn-dependent peptidase
MLNRSLSPALNEIDSIDFIKPKTYDINQHVKLYHMGNVPNETARVDFYFHAGTTVGKRGVSALTNGILLSGTAEKTSVELHNAIDYLGGYFESGIGQENGLVTMYALRENMLPILHILHDAITNVAFHTHEFEDLLNERKQKFKVSLEKVSFLAQRAFQERLFNDSPYGRITEITDFDSISIDELKSFHRDNYLNGLKKVVVIGNFSQDDIDALIDLCGKWAQPAPATYFNTPINLKEKYHFTKEGALQTAIRVGRSFVNKTHEDFEEFLVLNTILGDYFGSRLMGNIREDKGYTYGIGSMVVELQKSGYFLIATEVGAEHTEATLTEIKKEFERLQNELVSEEELSLVKSYMLGQLLKSADGAYAMMDLHLSVEPFEISLDYYNESIERIKGCSPERIQELAKKYLNWNEMTVVSAG